MLNALRRLLPSNVNQELIDDAAELAAHDHVNTPDYSILQQCKYQLLFVYNEFQKGCREHEGFMDFDAKPCGQAFTVDDHFTVWKKNLGKESFPIALVGDRKASETWYTSSRRLSNGVNRAYIRVAPKARIKGEVYAVRPYQYLELDKYYENTVQFDRVRVKLVMPYTRIEADHKTFTIVKTHTSHIIRAWMYMGRSDYWSDLLDCGINFSLIPHYEGHGKLNTYYRYNDKQNR